MGTILFTVVLTLFGLYAGALALNLGGVATRPQTSEE